MKKTIVSQSENVVVLKHGDESIDRDAYKKEFDFESAGKTKPGQMTGYIRFVEFDGGDSGDHPAIVSDCQTNGNFDAAMIATFVHNDTSFKLVKKWIDAADRVRNGMPIEMAVFGAKIGIFDEPDCAPNQMELLLEVLEMLYKLEPNKNQKTTPPSEN